jgi:hypothetical protein
VPGGGRPAEEEITMRYLALLAVDESTRPAPDSPERAERHAGYVRFAELAADAILAGEALQPAPAARTIRHGDGGDPLVTEGPFAETAEALGGFYILEAETLDDAIGLAREIPPARYDAVALRPIVSWQGQPTTTPIDRQYVALIYGKESPGDVPDTPEWDAGAADHGRFAEAAGDAVLAGAALHPIDTTTTVRVRDGDLLVTDGPFSEAAEVVGGFYLLAADDPDAAVALASRIPVGPGGAVEVRPVADMGADVRPRWA